MLKTTTVGDPPKEKFFTKKKAVRWVATNSVRFVVVGAINAVVPADTKVKKIRRAIGSHIIAEMVVQHVKQYIDDEFDEVMEEIKEYKDQASGIVEGVVVSSSFVTAEDEIVDAEIVEDTPTSTVQEESNGHESAKQQQSAPERDSGRSTEGGAGRTEPGNSAKDPTRT